MALTTQLRLFSIHGFCSPTTLSSSNNSKKKKKAKVSSSAFPRTDVGEKLYHIGTFTTFSKRGRKQREWGLQSTGEKEIITTGENAVPADSTGEKNVEQNSSGPPVLTIVAGLVVLAGFLWVAGSVLLWFIRLFFK